MLSLRLFGLRLLGFPTLLAAALSASACTSGNRLHVDDRAQAPAPPSPGPPLAAPATPLVLSAAADSPYEPMRFGSAARVRARQQIEPAAISLPVAAARQYANWRQRGSITVGHGYLSVLDVSPDERWLLVQSEQEARVRIYALATLQLVASHALHGVGEFARADAAFFPSEGQRATFIYASEAGLTLHDALTGERLATLDQRGAWQLRFSDDRRLLVAALSNLESQTSRLAFYAVTGPRSLSLVDDLDFSERVDGWDLTSDGKRLAVTLYPSTTIQLLDLEASALLWSKPAPSYARAVDIAPDNQLVAVAGKGLVLLDLADGELRAGFDEFHNNVHETRFSPAGDALAASAYDGKLRVLSTDLVSSKLQLLKTLRHGGTANVYALRFFAHGSRLASASGDKTVRLWGD